MTHSGSPAGWVSRPVMQHVSQAGWVMQHTSQAGWVMQHASQAGWVKRPVMQHESRRARECMRPAGWGSPCATRRATCGASRSGTRRATSPASARVRPPGARARGSALAQAWATRRATGRGKSRGTQSETAGRARASWATVPETRGAPRTTCAWRASVVQGLRRGRSSGRSTCVHWEITWNLAFGALARGGREGSDQLCMSSLERRFYQCGL